MSPILIAVLAALAAMVLALLGTWYAWRDYQRHPDRYGYRPGERQRVFTMPERGVTREPVHSWSSAPGYPSKRRSRLRVP